MSSDPTPARVDLPDGHVDLRTGHVHRATGETSLTTMELRALTWFVTHRGQDVSHEDLLHNVWEYATGVVSRAPYFTVRRLRAKLEVDPDKPVLLQTVHGHGYRFLGTAADLDPVGPRGNLPPLRPTLFGRDDALTELVAGLDAQPMVGLYGPPGVGKTTLAVATAAAIGGEVWLCPGDPRLDPAGVARAVAALLGRQPSQGDPLDPVHAIPPMMAGRGRVVLVLDDVAPDAAAALTQAWAHRVPELRVIATHNRRPSGPAATHVPPLSPPAGAALLRHAVLALGRPLPESAEADLQAISQRLDGLPLALELVAPRLRVTSPARLARSGDLGVRARLDDTIAQAWTQLDPDPAELLAWCAAFAGGATLVDLVAVTDHDEDRALDALQDLTDRCLVKVADPRPPLDEPRFSVFASVRAFLAAQDGHDARLERVHGHVASRGWALRTALDDGAADARTQLLDEAVNLEHALGQPAAELRVRLALDTALAAGGTPADRWDNACRALQLAEVQADPSWIVEALLVHAGAAKATGEDLPSYERALTTAVRPVQTVRAALGVAQHHVLRGDHAAAETPLAEVWPQLARGQHPVLAHAVLQWRLAAAVYRSDVPTARGLVEQVLAWRSTHRLEHLPQMNLSVWYDLIGEQEAMEAVIDADIQSHHRRGELAAEANAWMNKGYLLLQQDRDGALEALHRAVALARRAGNRQVEATARYNLSCELLNQLRRTEARAEGLASLALAEALENPRLAAICKLGLGHIAAARRDPEAATLLAEAAEVAIRCDDPGTTTLARMLLAPILHEQGLPDEAARVWRQAVEGFEQGPRSERFVVALEVHEALYDLVRGDPTGTEVLLQEHGNSGAGRLLRAWADARR